MMGPSVIAFVSLFFAGILAGEEFIVRYGLSGPLEALDDQPHIRLRQLLIRKLRVIVPIIFFAAILPGIAALVLNGAGPGFGFRFAGVLALLAWILITLIGTAPINKSALEWQPDAPPANWKAQISHWKRLDTWRTWLAILAFACFLAGVAISG
jgi:hypothetical protein